MNQKNLFKLLKLVESVSVRYRDNLSELIDQIAQGKATVIKKRWHISWKEKDNLDLAKVETWRTYENCFDLTYMVENNKLICEAVVYEGDMLDGRRKDRRFSATIQLPNSFIGKLQSWIESEFNFYSEDAYQNHLEEQKKQWIKEYQKSILNDTKSNK
jgi:hypothetical protein